MHSIYVVPLDGQALATRLSKQINRVSKELKKEIKVFNEVNRLPFSNLQTLTFDEVKDPDSEFWLALHTASPDDRNECPVPLGVKRKAVELQNLMDRSREEQILIKKEMENTWKYFFNQHQVVTQFLVTLANHERLLDVECGEEMFARKKLLGIKVTLSQLQSQLSGYITVEQPEFHFVGNLDFHDNDIEPGTDDEEEITVCTDLNDSESEFSEEEYDNDSANDDDGLDDN